jgi:ClpP class serine protease
MRLAHILHAIYCQPWLVLPDVHHRIQELVKLKLSVPRADFQARDRVVEICGDKVTLPSMRVENGIAYIPFAGVLLKGAGDWEKWAGALAHEDVSVDIKEALDNPKVAAIMFDVDSPGGTCAGSFDLADLIVFANSKKPCMAWVENLCCSAAFLSMSGCDLIYGNRMSELGAVECYMPWLDVSARYKQFGYEVDIIKPDQSTHAAAGYPGTSLTEEQREYLKSQVTDLLNDYVEHLAKVRSQIPEEAMDGRTFIGDRAVKVGMLDSVTTKEQADADLRKIAGIA